VIPAAPFPHDAAQLFLARVDDVIETALVAPRLGGYHAVVQSDARQLPLVEESVDLVVTSPPYLGMIDYARANRLTFAWFGWNLGLEMQNEIGARFKRGRKASETEYVAAMAIAAAEVTRILKPGAYCAIVIGASRRFPTTHQVVVDLFARGLDVVWGPISRIPTRRRVSERLGTESVEFLCVYRKTS
jgi:hypothetical protein